jgi:pimeloyl-ACP methyl ester carboxylesterase
MATKILKTVISFVLLIAIFSLGIYFIFPETAINILVAMERKVGGLHQNNITVDGLKIEYLEGGKGEILILLHGFGADKDNWTRLAKYLTPHYRIIAPDLPGFGESSAPNDIEYTIDAQVDRIKAFITSMQIKTFHIGGSSMGGSIAGAYASKYPEDIKSLLLISPGGVVSAELSEMHKSIKEGGQNPLIVKSYDDYDRMLDLAFTKKPFIPGVIKRKLSQVAIAQQPRNDRIWEDLARDWEAQPLEQLLHGLTIPSLIVWGTDDKVLHVSGAKILAGVMPNAHIAIMDGLGHVPMIENPKEFSKLYMNFMTDI